MNKLNGALTVVGEAVDEMGLDKPGGLEAGLTDLQQGADRLAGGSQQVADGVNELVGQVKLMASGLDQASTFLLTMRHDAADSSMAGFNIPAEVLNAVEFQKAGKAFVSPTAIRCGTWCKPNSTRSVPRRWIRSTRSMTSPGARSPTPHSPTPRYRWAVIPQRGGESAHRYRGVRQLGVRLGAPSGVSDLIHLIHRFDAERIECGLHQVPGRVAIRRDEYLRGLLEFVELQNLGRRC